MFIFDIIYISSTKDKSTLEKKNMNIKTVLRTTH
jgi:hypothetical protein